MIDNWVRGFAILTLVAFILFFVLVVITLLSKVGIVNTLVAITLIVFVPWAIGSLVGRR